MTIIELGALASGLLAVITLISKIIQLITTIQSLITSIEQLQKDMKTGEGTLGSNGRKTCQIGPTCFPNRI